MDSPAGLVLRVCCSSRCRLTALTSIALFLLILLTSATNYLSVPWTTISSSTVLARSVNSTTFQLRLELRHFSRMLPLSLGPLCRVLSLKLRMEPSHTNGANKHKRIHAHACIYISIVIFFFFLKGQS
jgi:hypothetical protein